jgi:hypothetical protein
MANPRRWQVCAPPGCTQGSNTATSSLGVILHWLQVRLQIMDVTPKPSALTVLGDMWKTNGVRGMYTGLSAALTRQVTTPSVSSPETEFFIQGAEACTPFGSSHTAPFVWVCTMSSETKLPVMPTPPPSPVLYLTGPSIAGSGDLPFYQKLLIGLASGHRPTLQGMFTRNLPRQVGLQQRSAVLWRSAWCACRRPPPSGTFSVMTSVCQADGAAPADKRRGYKNVADAMVSD